MQRQKLETLDLVAALGLSQKTTRSGVTLNPRPYTVANRGTSIIRIGFWGI